MFTFSITYFSHFINFLGGLDLYASQNLMGEGGTLFGKIREGVKTFVFEKLWGS